MNKEEQYFIQLLRDYVHGRPTETDESVDFENIIYKANIQQVQSIVYNQTKRKELYQFEVYALYAYKSREWLMKGISVALQDADIPYYLIKGYCLAPLYAKPYQRSMGDIDIIVREENIERAVEVMYSQGFELLQQKVDEWTFRKNGFEFEVHKHLLGDRIVHGKSLREYSNRAWDYLENGQLNWNYHLVYMLLHTRRHLLYEGIGIRQFMDVAMVIQHDLIDWKEFAYFAEQAGITDFAKTALAFVAKWFELEIPTELAAIDSEFYEIATTKILNDGVFGQADEMNFSNQKMNEDMISLKTKRRLMDSVFPSRAVMLLEPEFAYLAEKPYLLPVSWIHRFGIKWKKRAIIKEKFFPSKQRVNERKDLLSKWNV